MDALHRWMVVVKKTSNETMQGNVMPSAGDLVMTNDAKRAGRAAKCFADA